MSRNSPPASPPPTGGDDPRNAARALVRQVERFKSDQDRQKQEINTGIKQVKTEIRKCIKRGDVKGAKIMAREIANAQKAKERIEISKANLTVIASQINMQIAQYRVTKCIKQSAEVMHALNENMKLPEMREGIQEFSAEMLKAGILEEEFVNQLDQIQPEVEQEAVDEEIDKIIAEVQLEQPQTYLPSGVIPNANPQIAQPQYKYQPPIGQF
ncbi:MAG: putative vacuolar sorting protein VPS24 [Streblomastix strix]|uniref:Putative vacuolar sorting protein VPS24 n=1 Tax=Streblomastix strix TaxID=222440 RepID=A0A5J4W4A5_9EUKA|nr:MAG: putative vacuolar sorting protein VPS24 [Streblomastix strix]